MLSAQERIRQEQEKCERMLQLFAADKENARLREENARLREENERIRKRCEHWAEKQYEAFCDACDLSRRLRVLRHGLAMLARWTSDPRARREAERMAVYIQSNRTASWYQCGLTTDDDIPL